MTRMTPFQGTRELDLLATLELQEATKPSPMVETKVVGMAKRDTQLPNNNSSSSPQVQWMYHIQEAPPLRKQDSPSQLLTGLTNRWVPTWSLPGAAIQSCTGVTTHIPLAPEEFP